MAAAATAIRTLIVEDDPDMAELLSQVLGAEGFETDVATTVGQALVKLEMGLRPTAVVLDLRLPDANGALVLWRVRRSGWDARVAIITGDTDAATRPELSRYKPDRIFTKPLDMGELVAWLKEGT